MSKKSPMKILLLQSYNGQETIPLFPLGLACLASCLQDYELEIVDLNLFDNPFEILEEKLENVQPDIICVSLRNIDNQNRLSLKYFYIDFQTIIRRIKQVSPSACLIVGGAGFSMFAQEIMEQNPEIDFGGYLEAEESLPELLKNLENPEKVKGIFFRNNGKVLFTGERKFPDLKNLPMCRKDIIDLSDYSVMPYAVGLETKRGCALNCAYCNYPFLSGNKVRLRDPSHIVDEIQDLSEKYGKDRFFFTDSAFNAPLNHACEICEEIIRRKLKVTWATYLDIRFATEKFLLLAKKAGCEVFIFSPDAVSQGALLGLKKGISKKEIDKTIELFLKNKELQNCHASFGFFLNPPGETFRGLIQTIAFYLKVKILLRGRGGSHLSWIRIEPYTAVHDIAVKKGILHPETQLLPKTTEGLNDLFYSEPPLNRLDFIILFIYRTARSVKSLLKYCLKR